MNHLMVIVSVALVIAAGSLGCIKAAPVQASATNHAANTMKMKITIGSQIFTATLYDNPTVTRLKAMLPLTLEMSELNGNEKYFHLSTNLPADDSNPGTIKAGDFMLWGGNSLVLFYESFTTSYSYTKIGRIENPSGLSSALGSGNVTVAFMPVSARFR